MKKIIEENKVKTFLLGDYGNFDDAVFDALISLKQYYPYIEIHCILPYKNWASLDWFVNSKIERGYDQCYFLETNNTFEKYAIIERNKKMIEESDFVIFYLDEKISVKSGTNLAYKYAISKHKKVFNLFSLLNSQS